MNKYDYQPRTEEYVVQTLTSGESTLVKSPTGSGKTRMSMGVLRRLSGRMLHTTPSLEISVASYIVLTGDAGIVTQSEAAQRRACESHGIWTTQRLLNALAAGEVSPPEFLSHDECHHSVDNRHDEVHLYCGRPPRVGWTATDFRGTPAETKKLRDAWGKTYTALSLSDAIERGVIARPDCVVWPLVNDELINVENGEFVVSETESVLDSALPAIVERAKRELWSSGSWNRPTMVRVPGVASADAFTQAFRAAGMGAVSVTGDTPRAERDEAFRLTVARSHVLVQVKVVGEGVDLPLRVCLDCSPTMSPVVFVQGATGRISRPVSPGEGPPLYIATNHNLDRHAYLWEGQIPSSQIRAAQLAWGPEYKPSRRTLARALGLEGFGKFVVSPVPLKDGSWASLYALQTKDGLSLYAVLLPPAGEPMFFKKVNKHTGRVLTKTTPGGTIEYPEKKYGPWTRIPSIPDATGYVSVKPGRLTDPMKEFWKSAAARKGLDPDAEVDARVFQALPILCDTGGKFK